MSEVDRTDALSQAQEAASTENPVADIAVPEESHLGQKQPSKGRPWRWGRNLLLLTALVGNVGCVAIATLATVVVVKGGSLTIPNYLALNLEPQGSPLPQEPRGNATIPVPSPPTKTGIQHPEVQKWVTNAPQRQTLYRMFALGNPPNPKKGDLTLPPATLDQEIQQLATYIEGKCAEHDTLSPEFAACIQKDPLIQALRQVAGIGTDLTAPAPLAAKPFQHAATQVPVSTWSGHQMPSDTIVTCRQLPFPKDLTIELVNRQQTPPIVRQFVVYPDRSRDCESGQAQVLIHQAEYYDLFQGQTSAEGQYLLAYLRSTSLSD